MTQANTQPRTLPPDQDMMRAMLAGDADYDGIFVFAVRTTGIFCRPSCHARKPRPDHVEFFRDGREAMFAGYRACRRCWPMGAREAPPTWVATILDHVHRRTPQRMRDSDLRALAIEPSRARRWFKQNYGLTFQSYQRAIRLGRAFERIRKGEKMASLGLDCGYDSDSGFRDAFSRTFGSVPTKAGPRDCIHIRMIDSPVGRLLLGGNHESICLLEFTDRRALETQIDALRKRFGAGVVPGGNRLVDQAASQLGEYFARRRRTFDLPLAYPGTPFQQAVWSELLKIPYGETISYATLAARVGKPNAQRAVGTANGANRIAIIIPCHRVVNTSGKLGGYGGGLWRKHFLLDLEAAEIGAPTAPPYPA